MQITREKLKHIHHIDDLPFIFGFSGVQQAVDLVTRTSAVVLGDGNSTALSIFSKIDGAPSIVCGPVPAGEPNAGEFFVGTKAALDNPSARYTLSRIPEITTNHTADLAHKLITSLIHLNALNIPHIMQGDLLFTRESITTEAIGGEDHHMFSPNTVTYAVNKNTEDGLAIDKAQMGIVFHTRYIGDTFANMHASFDPDLSQLSQSDGVWWKGNLLSPSDFTSNHHAALQQAITDVSQTASALKSDDFGMFNQHSTLAALVLLHTNAKIRQGQSFSSPTTHFQELVEFVDIRLTQESSRFKTDKKKQQVDKSRADIIATLHHHRGSFEAIVEFINAIQKAKRLILDSFSGLEGMSAYFAVDGSLTPSQGEGLVVADTNTNQIVKLVNRLEFSYQNFSNGRFEKRD